VSRHEVQWVAPAPLWEEAVDERRNPSDDDRMEAMRAPEILRFASDEFMDELVRVLERDPGELRLARAKPASFASPLPGADSTPAPELLKLYQPVHGDFYLVAASLVCRVPGLPDRVLDPATDDGVAFVLRRLADGSEWAWVDDPSAPRGRRWRRMGRRTGRTVARGEELQPLFPVSYRDGERRRRLFVGLVPTASGESYRSAGAFSLLAAPGSGSGAPAADPRPEELERILTRPAIALRTPPSAPSRLPEPDRSAAAVALERQKVEASRFVLLDLAEFLREYLRPVWDALGGAPAPPGQAAADVLAALATPADTATTTRWSEGLKLAWQELDRIAGDDPAAPTLEVNVGRSQLPAETLAARIVTALPPDPPPPNAAATAAGRGGVDDQPRAPKIDPGGGSYVLRCVYRRPGCPGFGRELISARSRPFAIASFFDIDAPARPIQISMPIDTSIKSLRRARKSVNIALASQLREQIARVNDLKQTLDGNFASGQSFEIGLMCSFSIPIITICALIVLMIFINLLNIIFWWLPFLRICFPVGIKGR
jgi:hypothetical protein